MNKDNIMIMEEIQSCATPSGGKLNKQWIDYIQKEGYEVLDMGDIPLKAGNYKGFSPFYAIEKLTIFGN